MNSHQKFMAAQGDHWRFGPAIAAFLIFFVLIFLCKLPGILSFILIPFVVLGSPVAAVAILIWAGVLAYKKLFRQAGAAILAVLLPAILFRPIEWTADYLHLALTVATDDTSEDFKAFDWSVGLAGGPNTFLIRDATDEIAIPLSQHKQPAGFDKGFGQDCAGNVRHLLGHYYVCTI